MAFDFVFKFKTDGEKKTVAALDDVGDAYEGAGKDATKAAADFEKASKKQSDAAKKSAAASKDMGAAAVQGGTSIGKSSQAMSDALGPTKAMFAVTDQLMGIMGAAMAAVGLAVIAFEALSWAYEALQVDTEDAAAAQAMETAALKAGEEAAAALGTALSGLGEDLGVEALRLRIDSTLDLAEANKSLTFVVEARRKAEKKLDLQVAKLTELNKQDERNKNQAAIIAQTRAIQASGRVVTRLRELEEVALSERVAQTKTTKAVFEGTKDRTAETAKAAEDAKKKKEDDSKADAATAKTRADRARATFLKRTAAQASLDAKVLDRNIARLDDESERRVSALQLRQERELKLAEKQNLNVVDLQLIQEAELLDLHEKNLGLRLKATEKAQAAQEVFAQKIIDRNIAMIEDESDRRMAVLVTRHERELEKAEEQGQDLNSLRLIQEKELLDQHKKNLKTEEDADKAAFAAKIASAQGTVAALESLGAATALVKAAELTISGVQSASDAIREAALVPASIAAQDYFGAAQHGIAALALGKASLDAFSAAAKLGGGGGGGGSAGGAAGGATAGGPSADQATAEPRDPTGGGQTIVYNVSGMFYGDVQKMEDATLRSTGRAAGRDDAPTSTRTLQGRRPMDFRRN